MCHAARPPAAPRTASLCTPGLSQVISKSGQFACRVISNYSMYRLNQMLPRETGLGTPQRRAQGSALIIATFTFDHFDHFDQFAHLRVPTARGSPPRPPADELAACPYLCDPTSLAGDPRSPLGQDEAAATNLGKLSVLKELASSSRRATRCSRRCCRASRPRPTWRHVGMKLNLAPRRRWRIDRARQGRNHGPYDGLSPEQCPEQCPEHCCGEA